MPMARGLEDEDWPIVWFADVLPAGTAENKVALLDVFDETIIDDHDIAFH